MPRPRLAAAVVACALALGGCGSSGSEPPSRQEAIGARLSAGDCARLAATVARQTGRPERHQSEPTAPNSRCEVEGRGFHVSMTLDSAHEARRRYSNRMVEQVQFNASDPAKVPHAVAGVGDESAYNHYASWIPAYSTLYAVRGNRWITLAYSVAGEPRPQRLRQAAALTRQGFRLSAR
ncbi:MAG TPA: hypothetical protein VFJ61_09950 [Solirubrobacterales bacterium]|nr:hypothetical protein [Solirubrobacterales bacterium]